MENALLWCALATAICSMCLAVVSARVCWRLGSEYSQLRRSLDERLSTLPSDAKYAKLSTDLAELFSTLESVTTTIKRLSSRAGMQDVRARRNEGPPPPGASKNELREYYLPKAKEPN